jgi:hypothetical protein
LILQILAITLLLFARRGSLGNLQR